MERAAHGRGPVQALPVQLGVQRTTEGPHVGEPEWKGRGHVRRRFAVGARPRPEGPHVGEPEWKGRGRRGTVGSLQYNPL
jgi:hypothetical protein